MREQRLLQGLAYWIPLALTATVLSLFIYGAVQQAIRQAANDPQIQLAEDAAGRLNAGQSAQAVLLPDTVDMGVSLAPFMIIYDESGSVRASSVSLHGQVPILPSRVLRAVRDGGEDRFTWQPEPRNRNAVVVTRYSAGAQSGFVLAGRSLREVEKREEHIRNLITLGLVVALLGAFAAVMAVTTLGASWRS